METEEGLKFVNDKLIRERAIVLSDKETEVFRGIWNGECYETISSRIYINNQSCRAIGATLYKKVREVFQVTAKIDRNNLKAIVTSLYYEHQTTRTNIPISSNPPTFVTNDNPFLPTSGIIDRPELFFNHESTLRNIFETLNSGSSVSLLGERQIGKSSVLKAVARQTEALQKLGRTPIYLNLQRVSTEAEFYSYLCKEIGIQDCSGFRLNLELENHKLLLLIDEVEKMKGNGFTHDIRDFLRGFAEGMDAPFKLIMAASKPLDQLFGEGDTSPLANICSSYILDNWDKQMARAFIMSRLKFTSIQFAETEIQELIETSSGHPQKLMVACWKKYREYRDGG